MTKDERNRLIADGKTILRAQFDGRKNRWVIAKLSKFDRGWKRFGAGWYLTTRDTEEKIDMIVSTNDQYVKEVFHDNGR